MTNHEIILRMHDETRKRRLDDARNLFASMVRFIGDSWEMDDAETRAVLGALVGDAGRMQDLMRDVLESEACIRALEQAR